jgi:hypothetical protein
MTKRRALVSLLIACLVGGSVVKISRILEDTSSAQLFWNADEAYLLVTARRLGWRMSPFGLLLSPLATWGVPAHDIRTSIAVFRITAERVDRHVVENLLIRQFGVVDGKINDGQWRWDADHFAPATREESAARPPLDVNYTNIDGWSKRSFLKTVTPPEGSTVAFELSGQPAVLTLHRTKFLSATIDVQIDGQPPQRLWSLDERSRTVRKTAYDAAFKK